MSAANYPAFEGFIERPDFDGQPLHRTAGDPGGATSWGWTFATWHGFALLHGYDPSYAHFAAMTRADFRVPTKIEFWNAINADAMPSGPDLVWADFHFGSGGATRVLEEMLGSGGNNANAIGPLTIDALNTAWSVNATNLIRHMTSVRLSYYTQLSDYDEFKGGWIRRAQDCCALAITLAETAKIAAMKIGG